MEKPTTKQVKSSVRYQLKSNGQVMYTVSSNNGKKTYCTTIINGKATGCTCPDHKPCYHMAGCEALEAVRAAVQPGEQQLPMPQDATSAETSLTQRTQQTEPTQQVKQRMRREKQPSLTIVLLIVLVVCMIIGSLIFYASVYRPGQPNTQSTAIARAFTLTIQKTTTAQAQTTATSTSFQDSFDQLTAGPPTWSDAMTNPGDKIWD